MTAKELRAKCEQDIKDLQETCNHPESTECLESWAPGHMTGRVLKVCNVCEKVLGDVNNLELREVL